MQSSRAGRTPCITQVEGTAREAQSRAQARGTWGRALRVCVTVAPYRRPRRSPWREHAPRIFSLTHSPLASAECIVRHTCSRRRRKAMEQGDAAQHHHAVFCCWKYHLILEPELDGHGISKKRGAKGFTIKGEV